MANTTEPLVFPIACYVGQAYDVNDGTTTYDLRGGWGLVHLDKAERDVWGCAHGSPEVLEGKRPWTRSALVEAARSQVGSRAEEIVSALLTREVLVEATPDTREAVAFAKRFRLVPLQLGLGNSEDEPWLWRIGTSEAVIGVTSTVYHIWQWGHLYKSLWGACKALAKIDNEETGASKSRTTPEAILTEVLTTAHALLATGCAYFDVPYDWGAE